MVAGGYVLTAVPPSGVNAATSARFTSPNHVNLIVSKSTILECYTLRASHLEHTFQLPYRGGIDHVLVVQPPGCSVSMLFIATFDLKCALIAYHPMQQRIVTLWSGDLSHHFLLSKNEYSTVARAHTGGEHVVLISDYGRVLVLGFEYGGLNENDESGVTGCEVEVSVQEHTMDHGTVSDVEFLHQSPTEVSRKESLSLAVLYSPVDVSYETPGGYIRTPKGPFVQTYEILLKKGVLVMGRTAPSQLKGHQILSVLGGVRAHVLVSQTGVQVSRLNTKLVVKYDPESGDAPVIHPARLATPVPGKSAILVLTKASEVIYINVTLNSREVVTAATPVACGMVNAVFPSCVTIIHAGNNGQGQFELLTFIGSQDGPSSLVVITPDASAGSRIQLVRSFDSLSSLRDAYVTGQEEMGHRRQVVCCSGTGKAGAIRALRPSLVVSDMARLDQEGVTGVWAVHSKPSLTEHSHLVLSFASETRVLSLMGADVEEAVLPGLEVDQTTRYVASCKQGEYIVQICDRVIRLVAIGSRSSSAPNSRLDQWTPDRLIVLHAMDSSLSHMAVTFGGSDVSYFHIPRGSPKLQLQKTVSMPSDIAALSFVHLAGHVAPLLLVAQWNSTVIQVVSTPDLSKVYTIDVGAQVKLTGQIKAIYCGQFDATSASSASAAGSSESHGERIKMALSQGSGSGADIGETGQTQLFLGTGDGQLVCAAWHISSLPNQQTHSVLQHVRVMSVGSAAISFVPFEFQNETLVYACGDNPRVVRIRPNIQDVSILPGNANHITAMATFQWHSSPGAWQMASVSASGVKLGVIEALDRLAIRSMPLRFTPFRIAYHRGQGVYVVLVFDERKFQRSVSATQGSGAPASAGGSRQTAAGGGTGTISPYSIVIAPSTLTGATRTHRLSPDYQTTALCTAFLGGSGSSGDDGGIGKSKAKRSSGGGPSSSLGEIECICVASFIPAPPESRALPDTGRIDIFTLTASGRQVLVPLTHTDTSGMTLAMQAMGSRLVACTQHRITIYEMSAVHGNPLAGAPTITAVCHAELPRDAGTAISSLSIRAPFILVADQVQSCSLFVFREAERVLVPVSSDMRALWPSACVQMSPDWLLGGDGNGSIFACIRSARVNSTASGTGEGTGVRDGAVGGPRFTITVNRAGETTGVSASMTSEEGPLNPVAQYHIGDSVRKLVKVDSSDVLASVFITYSGRVGLVSLMHDQTEFELFSRLQAAMRRHIMPVCGIGHEEFRAGDAATGPFANPEFFVDGDLISQFSSLPSSQKHEIATELGSSFEALTQRINEWHNQLLEA